MRKSSRVAIVLMAMATYLSPEWRKGIFSEGQFFEGIVLKSTSILQDISYNVWCVIGASLGRDRGKLLFKNCKNKSIVLFFYSEYMECSHLPLSPGVEKRTWSAPTYHSPLGLNRVHGVLTPAALPWWWTQLPYVWIRPVQRTAEELSATRSSRVSAN